MTENTRSKQRQKALALNEKGSKVGKRGGSGGRLPLSGFGPPLLLPLSNHCLPHSTIFELDSPTCKKFHSPTSEILTPLSENICILQKRSHSLSSILVTPPLRISELDSPTWKILTPLLEKFCILTCTQTPLVQFWWLPPSGFQSWTPLPENFWLP